ncbi:MAG: division/cell wall cluster transcriptional repressor MraZ [Peptoniphilus sp.]|nr:division/cell wall cluster transcriptional repressor MraZ [Peptoniphilus sp.]MDD7363128.1 division/cell wall cluster transcriptional repressor MraZ [Bacillota bacterium]MDY6044350.1 division/cell wall cluster transcriptional repressor MraZ [Peptoniphilus sp.]
MFYGENRHTIDSKGRLVMPAKFRDGLQDGYVMTKGLDRCIFLFPLDEWKRMEEKLKALPLTHKDARAFVRYFFSGACDGTLDKQGRIKVPQNLMSYAELTSKSVIIGVGTRMEIWSEALWDDYTDDESLSYDQIAQQLADLGI